MSAITVTFRNAWQPCGEVRTYRPLATGLLAIVFCAVPPGCQPHPLAEPTSERESPATAPADLCAQLDDVLHFTFRERNLRLSQHAAWQILHGVLAYQRDFLVERDGQLVSAVDHILRGGTMKGWTVQLATDQPSGLRGLRAILEPGSQAGQGHADQWLAILAQCDLPLDEVLRVGEESVTMRDFVSQVQWDVPRNVEREYSWTLIGLTYYLSTDTSWTASDGKTWSIEQLVQIEAEQELATSACGGTHRVIGLAMALHQHVAVGGQLDASWSLARSVVAQAIADARQYQNSDGSFSTRYFASPGSSPDLAQNLGTTGHILEFLSLSLDDQELRAPWVQRAVANLCELFRLTRDMPLECGALYHAAHGLVLYRDRVYGPKNHAAPPAVIGNKSATSAAGPPGQTQRTAPEPRPGVV